MSSLDNLKKEAKRRLKALRVGDPAATLRAVQHALAREHGFESWIALRGALEGEAPAEETLAALLNEAAEGEASPDDWRLRLERVLHRQPNALRAGYQWSDAIGAAAAAAPGFAVETLIRHGASVDVNTRPPIAPEGASGYRPIHHAAYHGNAEAVTVLLRYGADMTARDGKYQRTPADWADAGGHTALAERLREAARDALQRRREAQDTRDPAALFLYSACWDHHVHGAGDHRMYDRAAQRLLANDPAIGRHSIYTAVVSGDIDEVRRRLRERPETARERGGPREWTPLLYLCYTRLTLQPTLEHAEPIARLLLDHGADPTDFYMAGDSQYTTLVGAAGEGEQASPRQPWGAAVYQLLLERGAGPYDIQVLYNTHFSADMIWWLELTYRHSLARGLKADWDDPAWRMLDMGGYGPGAYFVLDHAIRKNRVALVEWALAHGADPNVMSSPHPKFRPRRSLLEQAVIHGRTEIADLLRRHGARAAAAAPLEPWEAFVDACVRLDRDAVVAALAREPRLAASPEPLFEAARLNRPDVLALLAGAGYSLDAADAHNTRALHHAAAANALDAARFLLERGVDPDPRETRWNATPIGWASHGDHAEMIDLLSRDSRNIWTLSFRGYVERVREILAQDPALARQADADGITPLWWLPDDEENALALVDLLIAAGADPAAKSGSGRTAADWARRRGMLDVAARLET